MGQGFLQSFSKDITVCSAGTNPSTMVSKKAIAVMKEAGIDIRGEKPKHVGIYLHEVWDYVITVCDDANETCPVFQGKVRHRVHMPFEDPSFFKGSEEQTINEFRRIRDQIKETLFRFYKENIL